MSYFKRRTVPRIHDWIIQTKPRTQANIHIAVPKFLFCVSSNTMKEKWIINPTKERAKKTVPNRIAQARPPSVRNSPKQKDRSEAKKPILRTWKANGFVDARSFLMDMIMRSIASIGPKFISPVAFALKTSVEATSYLSLPLRIILLGSAPQISGEFQTILN